jgi:prolipoprotein diacylglyceryltransferase
MLGVLAILRHRAVLKDRLFFLYLVAYGSFRFIHEFLRDTPRVVGPFSGYHLIALGMVATGVIAWGSRNRQAATPAGNTVA